MKCWGAESGCLPRPHADFPNWDDTPYPPSPSSRPEPLWSSRGEGAGALGQSLLIPGFVTGLESRPRRLLCPRKPGWKPQTGSQVPGPCWAGGCLLSSPSTWPQWSFSGSSCRAEKGETDCSWWAMPGKQRRGGLCTGSEVPFERHYRSRGLRQGASELSQEPPEGS